MTINRHSAFCGFPNAVALCLASLVFLAARLNAQSSAGFPDVLYLRFNEGAGSTTADAAIPGTGLTPTSIGSIGWNTTNPAIGAAAFQTQGNSANYFEFNNGSIPPATSFTIEFLATIPAQPNGGVIVICDSCIPIRPQLYVRFGWEQWPSAGLQLCVTMLYGNTGYTFCVAGQIPSTVWQHLAIVVDGTSGLSSAYFNSNPMVPLSPPNLISNWDLQTILGPGFVVGGYSLGCGSLPVMPASIDELRIWSTARTPAQIAATANIELFPYFTSLRFGIGLPANLGPTGAFSASGAALQAEAANELHDIPVAGFLPSAMATLSGSYSLSDYLTLSDLVVTGAQTKISVVPGLDELVINHSLSIPFGSSPQTALSGLTGARPTLRRELRQIGPAIVQRVGSGTLALDNLAVLLQGGMTTSWIIDLTEVGPRISAVSFAYIPPPVTVQFAIGTHGNGDVEVGVVGVAPGAQLIQVFDINPTIPIGTGPFFGMALSAAVWSQLSSPFPSPPFKDFATAFGTYFFAAPPGVLPPGLTIDEMLITLSPGPLFVSPIQRVTL